MNHNNNSSDELEGCFGCLILSVLLFFAALAGAVGMKLVIVTVKWLFS